MPGPDHRRRHNVVSHAEGYARTHCPSKPPGNYTHNINKLSERERDIVTRYCYRGHIARKHRVTREFWHRRRTTGDVPKHDIIFTPDVRVLRSLVIIIIFFFLFFLSCPYLFPCLDTTHTLTRTIVSTSYRIKRIAPLATAAAKKPTTSPRV